MAIIVEKMGESDIPEVARINSASFSPHRGNQELAVKWVRSNFSAYPRNQYFVAREGGSVVGYVMWMEKGGFRKESVWELEQIAVDESQRGKGVGTLMITESLASIKEQLQAQGRSLKLVEVTTGTWNEAQELYKKTLGAQPEAVVKDLFRGDEVIMIARTRKSEDTK